MDNIATDLPMSVTEVFTVMNPDHEPPTFAPTWRESTGLVTTEYHPGDAFISMLSAPATGDEDGLVWLNRDGALQLMLALAEFVKQA